MRQAHRPHARSTGSPFRPAASRPAPRRPRRSRATAPARLICRRIPAPSAAPARRPFNIAARSGAAHGADDAVEVVAEHARCNVPPNSRSRSRRVWTSTELRPELSPLAPPSIRRGPPESDFHGTARCCRSRQVASVIEPAERPDRGAANQRRGIVRAAARPRPRARHRRNCRWRSARCARSGRGRCA